PSRRITVGVFMWRSRRWKDTEHQSSWRSTAVRRNCVERRKARCAGGWGCKSSISPMLAMWTMLGPPAAPWRNWTWSWETMSRPRSSMTLGRRRTKRAIRSTFRSRTWKSG
ncbi:Holliday junction resolvase, partial [Dysosmobacter welbionis]